MPKPRLWMDGVEFRRLITDNAAAVETSNRDTLQRVSLIISMLMIMLTVTALVLGWNYMLIAYIPYGVFNILLYVFCRLALPGLSPNFSIRPVTFLFSAAALTFAVSIAFLLENVGTLVTFIVLLILLPTLIIDRMGLFLVYFAAGDALVIALSLLRLEMGDAIDSIANVLVFSFVGLFVGRYICEIKLKAMDSQRRLALQSYTDSLTDLGNRRKLFERLGRMEQPGQTPLRGVIMMDIDNFKLYNDRYGHQAGDDCLKSLGRCFLDFAQKNGMEIFRYGGEEFIGIATSGGYGELEDTAQALLLAVRGLNIPFCDSPVDRVTVSVGYAENGDDCTGYETCISRADSALYAAKGEGRNMAVGFFDSRVDKTDAARLCSTVRAREDLSGQSGRSDRSEPASDG